MFSLKREQEREARQKLSGESWVVLREMTFKGPPLRYVSHKPTKVDEKAAPLRKKNILLGHTQNKNLPTITTVHLNISSFLQKEESFVHD